ncbi:hypothetical protein HMPREF9413_1663 [Paenibacillus sp. HGF7]|nr:hypothetical protein HMPREF9413_1663 [Paenibacillus sp. HGF7]
MFIHVKIYLLNVSLQAWYIVLPAAERQSEMLEKKMLQANN